MKTMNRRDFLKLTGASAIALAFVGCGSSGGGAPATSKEAQIENAINAYRREKGLKELKHEDVIAEYAGMYTSLCEAHGTTSIDWDGLTELEQAKISEVQAHILEAHFSTDTVGKDAVTIGMGEDEDENPKLIYTFPANDTELSTQLAPHKENIAKPELRYIGVSTATVEGKTYWLACLVGKKLTDTE